MSDALLAKVTYPDGSKCLYRRIHIKCITHTYIHKYIHTYIHKYIHTYIHKYIHT